MGTDTKMDRRRIVNFSRRVDCAPFEEWFIKRLREGYAYGINPFTRKPYEVKLTQKDVKLMILWTKAPGKILRMVDELLSKGIKAAVFVTINNYDRWLEPFTPTLEENLSGLRDLVDILGMNSVWWRFDPVVPTDRQDFNWLIDHFGRLLRKMEGLISRCITSVVHVSGPAKYRQCAKNIAAAAARVGQKLKTLTREEKLTWVGELSEVLKANLDIKLEVCCHPFLENKAVHHDQTKKWSEYLLTPKQLRIIENYPNMITSHCIRAEALNRIGVCGDRRDGSHSLGSKRKGDIRYDLGMCYCRQSTDIGGDVPCPHGCVYCQWPHVEGEEPAQIRVDPENPSLSLIGS